MFILGFLLYLKIIKKYFILFNDNIFKNKYFFFVGFFVGNSLKSLSR